MFMKKYKFLLVLIFLLALFLRLFRLGSLPHTFHEDEVLSGYVGRYILQNGFDLYGNKWPIWYFNKFGDYYIIGPIYLSGLSTFLFGINEFATRFPAALFGALTIFPFFYLILEIFNNKKVALFSSFFLSFLPWHLVLSRSTTEGVIGSFFFLAGVYFLLKNLKKYDFKNLFLCFIFFLVGYWIYHPFRLYPFLTLFGFILIYFSFLRRKAKPLFLLIFLTIFFFGFSFYISQTYWGKGRFEQTSIFSILSGVFIRYQDLYAQDGGQHPLLTRFFHNKLIAYGREFLNQYLSYLSPVFLFINGWSKSRYFVPESGPLFFGVAILIIFGFFNLKEFINEKNKKNIIFYFYLLLISLIPASFTVVESPNPHRSLLFGILSIGLAGFGLERVTRIKIKKFKVLYLFLILIFFEFILFWHNFEKHFDYASSLVRNDPQKEVAKFIINNETKYQRFYLPAEAAMSWYYLFYKKDFNQSYSKYFKLDSRIEKTGKVFYIENSCPSKAISSQIIPKNSLIIDRYNCVSDDKFKEIGKITGVNILLSYKILQN